MLTILNLEGGKKMPSETIQVMEKQDVTRFAGWLKSCGIDDIKVEGRTLTLNFDTATFDADKEKHWFQAFEPFGSILTNVISPSFYSWLRYHGADGSQRASPNSPSPYIIYFPLPRRS